MKENKNVISANQLCQTKIQHKSKKEFGFDHIKK